MLVGLNCIENLWFPLKEKTRELAPGLQDMTATEVKRVLEETAPDAWLQIDPARFQKLVDSIPRRIAACIAAEWWYTKYWSIPSLSTTPMLSLITIVT